MATTSILQNCPQCGCPATAWTDDGVRLRVRCKMCGYEGVLPHPDLKDGAWRVGRS
jgi:Zn ribbon nucleic-acid-binding protein